MQLSLHTAQALNLQVIKQYTKIRTTTLKIQTTILNTQIAHDYNEEVKIYLPLRTFPERIWLVTVFLETLSH